MNKRPTVFDDIKAANSNSRIKIRVKKNYKQIRFSIYFDVVSNGKRSYSFPKLYITGLPRTKKVDKEQLRKAKFLRDEKEMELFRSEHDFQLKDSSSSVNFIEYFKNIAVKKNTPNHKGTLKQLLAFGGGVVPMSSLTEQWCENFKSYLSGNLKVPTARTYFVVFKSVLKKAVKDELISKNPANDIIIKKIESKREFLSNQEIQQFILADTHFVDIKNAFLFGIFTSCRLGDIRELKFSDIRDGYLYYTISKNNNVNRLAISDDALKIVDMQRESHPDNETIFPLTKSGSDLNTRLRNIAETAGITKHVSFHVSRHTAATRWLNHGVDIVTVKELMGHSDIATTLIYAKLLNAKKDSYLEKIPNLI